MKKTARSLFSSRLKGQRGAVIVLVAISMVVFLGMAALAIDLSHLYVVRNELHNAADAGALAGARKLYNETGTAINSGANQEAFNAATGNKSMSTTGTIAVDVNWTSGNTGDVQRGHWSFGLGSLAKGFYPNSSLVVVPMVGTTEVELDQNLNFINAVRVVARRQATPASSFFARIFGHQNFTLEKTAVAYVGFAGSLRPADVEQPIAICEQSILVDNAYNCNIGRMLGDGQVSNSAAWTNFSQPCSTANTDSVRDILSDCSAGNRQMITVGVNMGTTNGVVDALINHPSQPSITRCWKQARYDTNGDNIPDASVDTDGDGWPDQPWNVTLPVIDCPGGQVGNCMKVVGAV